MNNVHPNFSLKSTITRILNRAVISNHRVVLLVIPADVQRQIANRQRIWTRGKYSHSVDVTTPFGTFEMAWDDDSSEPDYPRRYMAEKIYYFNERMSAITAQKAA